MWFDVLFYCVALSPAPPLTQENILKAVEGVEDVGGLSQNLNGILYSENIDINSVDVVEDFIEGRGHHKQPSWRAVIFGLDETGETHLADQIRHYAEPVQGR